MACFNPMPAWYSSEVNPSGKRSLEFSRRGTQLDNDVLVGCGKCDGCYADQSMMWAIRVYHESQMVDQSCFLTLTYDEEHCPSAISKRDLQLFFKRLRKDCKTLGYEMPKISYFACGEYGTQTHRPHYHAVICGADFRGGAFTYDVSEGLYANKYVDSKWKNGSVTIGSADFASILYTTGYVAKKIGDPDCFRVMSRGLGKSWLQKHVDDLERLESVVIEGTKYPIPPQYFRWAETELENAKANRKIFARELNYNQRESKRLALKAKLRDKGETL